VPPASHQRLALHLLDKTGGRADPVAPTGAPVLESKLDRARRGKRNNYMRPPRCGLVFSLRFDKLAESTMPLRCFPEWARRLTL
jgi:hypothetical protein